MANSPQHPNPNQQSRPQQQQQQPRPEPPKQEPPKQEEQKQPMPEQKTVINTRTETPSERFRSKAADLYSKVIAGTITLPEAIKQLHSFWRDDLTFNDREELIDQNNPNSVLVISDRLAKSAEALLQEVPLMVGMHNNAKGF